MEKDRLWKAMAYASRLDLNQTYKQFLESIGESDEDGEPRLSKYLYEASRLIL